MKKSILRRATNRMLHLLARFLPGATGLRPALHRLRGMQIGANVFIGDEAYLENEYPELVEIQEGVQISLRVILLAHTCGPGRVVIEKDAYIGPNAVIATSGGRCLRVGAGSVIGAGVVVTHDVPPHVFVAPTPAKPIARALVPLSRANTVEEFVRGLGPLTRAAVPTAAGGEAAKPVGRPAAALQSDGQPAI
jgi:hypothetical protein